MRTRLRILACLSALLAHPVAAGIAHAQSIAVSGTDSAWRAYPRGLSKEWQRDNIGRRKAGIDWDKLAQINRLPGVAGDYQLGPGDKIEFEVIGQAPLEREISPTGHVSVPFAGDVKVADLTAEEAEAAIAAALKAQALINDPQVLVSVTSYESKKVEVLGEVDRPGEYAITSKVTLMDLIFFAGGIDFSAARYGYLHRRGNNPSWRPVWVKAGMEDLISRSDIGRPGSEVIQVDLEPLQKGGVLTQNIVLQNGDLFYVPRRQMEFVYLLGEVNGPGAFELPKLRALTVTQALAAAGGTTRTANLKRAFLIRQAENGRTEEVLVDLAAMNSGLTPEIPVQPNDIIYVPSNAAKKVGLNVLSVMQNMMVYLLVF